MLLLPEERLNAPNDQQQRLKALEPRPWSIDHTEADTETPLIAADHDMRCISDIAIATLHSIPKFQGFKRMNKFSLI